MDDNKARYVVDFYDSYDGYWLHFGAEPFDDIELAKARADELQAKLPEHTDPRDHYGVIDVDRGSEVYCLRKDR